MTRLLTAALTLLAASSALAQGNRTSGETAGESLYDVHCSACHTAQVHWRDGKLAGDWTSLKAQVRRWQANQNLKWDEGQIDSVTRYLNSLYYRYPAQNGPLGALTLPR